MIKMQFQLHEITRLLYILCGMDYCGQCFFFTGKISPEGDFFLPLAYFWRNLDSKKTFLSPKIHSCHQKYILVAKNSSVLTIRHPFEPIFIHFQDFHPTSG
jgi:hypothetical protein